MRDMFQGVRSCGRDEGFTLVELIVTVTIIGILAAVVTTGVSGAASSAQTKANQAFFGDVQSAVDTYAASTPSVTGVPVTGTVFAGTETGYYTANGTSVYTTLVTDKEIDFASGVNSCSTFFRLNNLIGKRPGIVPTTTSCTIAACHN